MKLISNFNYATVAATCKLTRIAKVAAVEVVAAAACDVAVVAAAVASVVAAAGCRLHRVASCRLPIASGQLTVPRSVYASVCVCVLVCGHCGVCRRISNSPIADRTVTTTATVIRCRSLSSVAVAALDFPPHTHSHNYKFMCAQTRTGKHTLTHFLAHTRTVRAVRI